MRGRLGRLLYGVASFLATVVGAFGAAAGGGSCGPFNDVSGPYCPFVLTLYYQGITAGTSATTFSPDDVVTRGQAAVFVGKALQLSASRANPRAALGQWWTTTPQWTTGFGATTLPGVNGLAASADGQDVWVTVGSGEIVRVQASDGKTLGTWTVPEHAEDVLAAAGRVLLPSFTNSGTVVNGVPALNGQLYAIDPAQPPGPAALVADLDGHNPVSLAYDGERIWVVHNGIGGTIAGSISIVTPAAAAPWPSVAVPVTCAGCLRAHPNWALFDGSTIWLGVNTEAQRLDASGAVLQTVNLPGAVGIDAVFDGENLWIPIPQQNAVVVVRASNGQILETLAGNGLNAPRSAAFDGDRILVQNADSLSLWRAASLAPLGSRAAGVNMSSKMASDGANFWVPFGGAPAGLGRF